MWPAVAEASRNALALRYRILPYLYTLFSQAHFQGLVVAQAMWMVFPEDAAALAVDMQFFLGNSLLISPVRQSVLLYVSIFFEHLRFLFLLLFFFSHFS